MYALMSSGQLFCCTRCGRDNFRSQRGLNHHLTNSQNCGALTQAIAGPNGAPDSQALDGNLLYQRNETVPRGVEMMDGVGFNAGQAWNYDWHPEQVIALQDSESEDDEAYVKDVLGDDGSAQEALPQVVAMEDGGGFHLDNGHFDIEIPQQEDEQVEDDDDSVESVIMCSQDVPEDAADPKHIYVQRFRNYVKNCHEHFTVFDPKEVFAIKMLDALRRKRATLDTYETVMEVFYKHMGVIGEHQTLKDSAEYVGRQTLMKKLAIRYGIIPYQRLVELQRRKQQGLKKDKNVPYYLEKSIVLPHSKAKVDVIYFDFREQLVSLLTDPRLKDAHFCHHANDPLAPPPTSFTTVGEIITGLSYRKTYQALITSPDGQMLLPIVFYIDATSTGQFTDLKVEALKFSLGNLTNEVRSGVGKGALQTSRCYLPSVSCTLLPNW